MREKLIFDLSRSGRKGYTLSGHDLPETPLDSILPSMFLRKTPAELPEVSESEVVRHFVRLSTMNYHVDKNMYPLGSCTMKYNPKINDYTCDLPGFSALHPLQPKLWDRYRGNGVGLLHNRAGPARDGGRRSRHVENCQTP